MKTRKLVLSLAVVTLAALALFAIPKVRAQVSSIVGFIQPTNYLAPTAGAQMATVGGVTTNPSSNFVVQVAAGSAFCLGSEEEVPQVQLTLSASTTYMVVFNCVNQSVYAKTAVTGPGSPSASSGAFANVPGQPTSLLFATYPEIAIATVICNATACGNGGNGSITDARVPAQWSSGTPTGAHLLATKANGDVAGSGASPLTVTFTIPYVSTPICTFSDASATPLIPTISAYSNTGFTATGTAGHTINYICVGNPN